MFLALVDQFGKELTAPDYVRCDMTQLHWKVSPGVNSKGPCIVFVNIDPLLFPEAHSHWGLVVATMVCDDVIGGNCSPVIPLQQPQIIKAKSRLLMDRGSLLVETTLSTLCRTEPALKPLSPKTAPPKPIKKRGLFSFWGGS